VEGLRRCSLLVAALCVLYVKNRSRKEEREKKKKRKEKKRKKYGIFFKLENFRGEK
jgi:hypothetical protein